MKNSLSNMLERVQNWSEDRKEAVAEIISFIEEQDNNPYQLSDEQVAEVKRRLADPNPKYITLAQLDERLRRLGI